MFLNEDGTFKKEQEGVDIQALIDQAKESGDVETVKKLAVVRTRKILSNYGDFGQYSNTGDISFMTPEQTEAAKQFRIQDETTREALKAEVDNNNAQREHEKDMIKVETEANKDLITHQSNTNGSNQTPTLSDEGKRLAEIVMEKVNKRSEDLDKGKVIKKTSQGDYLFMLPNTDELGWWDDIVIAEASKIIKDEDQLGILLAQLGFYDYLTEFSQKYMWDDTKQDYVLNPNYKK
jgi:hypothetical protein